MSIVGEIGKFRAYGKSKYLGFFRRDSRCSQDRGALFVRNEEIISGAPVPRGVDGDRIRDDHHTFAGSLGPQNLLKHICVCRERANDDVRLKTREQRSELTLKSSETPKFCVVICLAIEPAINDSPGARRRIHQRQITSAHERIDRPVSFGEQIAQFHVGLVRCDASETVANSSRGAVVALSEAGREDQDSFFHRLLAVTNKAVILSEAKHPGTSNGKIIRPKLWIVLEVAGLFAPLRMIFLKASYSRKSRDRGRL